MKTLLALSVAMLLAAPGVTGAVAPAGLSSLPRIPDVVYVPTPQPVVDAMLELAKVQPGEIVYDLGCGDGRAVITAARNFGARGIGVDIDPRRIAESRENAASAGVSDRVHFQQADLFKMNFSDADVVFLYLLQALNVRLRPRILDELKPGTRVVSHMFTMGDWDPDETLQVSGSIIHLWVVPAKVGGDWKVTLPGGEQGTLRLSQEYQKLSGTLHVKGQSWPLRDLRLDGATLTFSYGERAATRHATAEISDGQLAGTLQRGFSARPEPWSGHR